MTYTLAQLCEQLAYDELSTLAIAGQFNGFLDEKREAQIVSLTNSALLDLYSVFVLKEDEVVIKLSETRTLYPLQVAYSQTNGTAADRFIQDSPDFPYTGDALRILSATSEHGRSIPINDSGLPGSIFTPSPTVLQIPCDCGYDVLGVTYQASHPTLTATDMSAEIQLPQVLWPALRSWIAYRVFSALGTEAAKMTAGEHFAAYQRVVDMVKEQDLVSNSQSVSTHKFCSNGWV